MRVQFSGRLARRQEVLGSNHSIRSQGSRGREGRKDKSVYYPEDRNQFQGPDHRAIPRVPGVQGL